MIRRKKKEKLWKNCAEERISGEICILQIKASFHFGGKIDLLSSDGVVQIYCPWEKSMWRHEEDK